MFFVAIAGQPPPPPQSVRIDASPADWPHLAAGATEDGQGWFTSDVMIGMTSASRPAQTSVAVNHANLRPGVYFGEVVYAYSKTEVSAIGVTLVVLPAGATHASDKERGATRPCFPPGVDTIRPGFELQCSGRLADSPNDPPHRRLRLPGAERPGGAHLLEWRSGADHGVIRSEGWSRTRQPGYPRGRRQYLDHRPRHRVESTPGERKPHRIRSAEQVPFFLRMPW